MRLFVAFDPGEEVLGRIEEARARVRGKAARAKWVRVEGMHVTLVFLGEVPDAGDVVERARAVASQHAPMTLRFEGAGCFGGRKARVLWVGVGGEVAALCAVQKELSTALADLGQGPEDRAYSPHLTLARAGESRGEPGFAEIAKELGGELFGEIVLREIVVYRSELSREGAKYTAVARLPFEGQSA
ncbi:RNA 2',3'-cyclic phosphodiesterase [Polyangium aurulentum]|uniref:RNA 2',3'-cyclic phosphodiesterase n=1 Tax=Polyangium aurulentum TaxID=2567896 RepID=UPI00146A8779|nr:RNA 2',3'-cyclic phosphodiesterase [Polyangium aurulentum]UQA54723.1 RNA 2',3'-cyclic phosphodiesterase [Polyangium aurulentum]